VAEPIRLGTRASLLARTQSATVGEALASASGRGWTEVLISTAGDDIAKPLNQPGSPGLFVSALRDALLDGRVDVIVHSYKDLPSAPVPGIALAAVPSREDPRDALVSRDHRTLAELPAGAVVGTSSPRRRAALLASRPDLVITPIRGNVDTRIRKVRDGDVDATVLAVAGLRRIGREGEIAQVFEPGDLLPAPAQGALAVECRADDADMLAVVARIDDPAARLVTAAEREILVGIDAACTTAVAASGTLDAGRLTVRAELFDEHGIVHAVAERSAQVGPDQLLAARALGLRTAGDLLGARDRPPVLLVRSEGNERDAGDLAALGVGAVCDPYVQITPVPAPDLLAMLAARPEAWLVVTSPMTVPSWVSMDGVDTVADSLRGRRVAATGERSASTLRELGCTDVLVPDTRSAQGLVDALADVAPGRAVFPCGSLALRTLPDGLRAHGWEVSEAVVYRTDPVGHVPASVELIRRGDVSAIVLRSPSAVRALTALVSVPHGIPVVCGGETTARAATAAGLTVAAVSSSPASESVARAVADVVASSPPRPDSAR
jgi:hydroxymethylbilane synthase